MIKMDMMRVISIGTITISRSSSSRISSRYRPSITNAVNTT